MNPWKLEEEYHFTNVPRGRTFSPMTIKVCNLTMKICLKDFGPWYYIEITNNLQNIEIPYDIFIIVTVSEKENFSESYSSKCSKSKLLDRRHKSIHFDLFLDNSNRYISISIKFFKQLHLPEISINIPKIEETSTPCSEKGEQSLTKEDDERKIKSYTDILNDFCNNLSKFQQKDLYTDIVIRCSTETFKVHRVILSARSPVFDAMFQNPMKENLSQEVEIKDMTPEVFRAILAYIYLNKDIEESCSIEMLFDILAAADKYMLQGLKNACVEKLTTSMSVINALNILLVADLYDTKLKENVIQFICKEYKALKNSPGWVELQNQKPSLMFDVMSAKVEFQQENSK